MKSLTVCYIYCSCFLVISHLNNKSRHFNSTPGHIAEDNNCLLLAPLTHHITKLTLFHKVFQLQTEQRGDFLQIKRVKTEKPFHSSLVMV